jgi:hypothetical protein
MSLKPSVGEAMTNKRRLADSGILSEDIFYAAAFKKALLGPDS